MTLRRIYKSKLGVTMVELIVVMAIMGIMAAALMGLITSSNNMYSKATKLMSMEEVASIVGNEIKVSLRKAIAITITTSATAVTDRPNRFFCAANNGQTILYDQAGTCFCNDSDSQKALYGSYNVAVNFKAERSSSAPANVYDVLVITVTVSNAAGNNYSLQFVPVLLNIGDNLTLGTGVTATTGAGFLHYALPA